MAIEKIREFVFGLLAKHGVSEGCLDDDSLIESNRFDSIDVVELIIFLEDEFNIYISSSDSKIMSELDTIRRIDIYINEHA